jgi:hypothetical protein
VTGWQPLSVRRGLVERDGPYEGVPEHLVQVCKEWLVETVNTQTTRFGDENRIAEVLALRLRVPTGGQLSPISHIWAACDNRGSDFFLDALDLTLLLTNGRTAQKLRMNLALGGSVWTVDDNGASLVRRVSETEQEAYEASVSSEDEMAAELSTAWGAAYGRSPNASDAWDHAIKAVELALWQIVTPDKPTSTLGLIIARLQQQAGRFELRLQTSSKETSNVEALVQMLRLMWPNPDRHGTGARRTPTQAEAQNVVHLAVLIVNWARTEALGAVGQ